MKTLFAILFSLVVASTAQGSVSFHVVGTSGGPPNGLGIGETVTVDVRISSTGSPEVFGVGAAAFGYDPAVLEFVSGNAVSGYLYNLSIPSVGSFGGLDNLAGGMLALNSSSGSPLIQFSNSASLTGRSGTGAMDPGLNGVIGGGDAQFRMTFRAIAPGSTTISFGTNGSLGNFIAYANGVTEQANNASLTVSAYLDPPPNPDYYMQVISDSPTAYWMMDDVSLPISDEVASRAAQLLAGNVTLGLPGALQDSVSTSIASGPQGATLLSPFDSELNTPVFAIESWIWFGSNCTPGIGSGQLCSVVRTSQVGVNDGFGLGAVDTPAGLTLTFWLNAGAQVPGQYRLHGPQIVEDQWYHVVGTYDGTTQKVFVDGVEYDAQPAAFVPNTFGPFEFFGSGLDVLEDGGLDEVAYYGHPLAADRILAHYLTANDLSCAFVGALPPTTAQLGARENHYCEDWGGVFRRNADLSRSVLVAADLADSDLAFSDLSHANLDGASLAGAVLAGTTFAQADLDGVDLDSTLLVATDLAGATTEGATFVGARYDDATVFPSGFTYDGGPTGFPGDAWPWQIGMIPVPEPSSSMAVVLGSLGLVMMVRRRNPPARL